MTATQMMALSVLDISSGNNIGAITGFLIDGDLKAIVALEIGGGWFSHPHYLPYASINAIDNDVVTISSPEVLVQRGDFKMARLISSLSGRKVYTEEGKNLGTVHEYDIANDNGEINSITVALDTFALGILLRSEGKSFEIPRKLISVFGDSVVVDNSISMNGE